jgi:16S rRNA C967 or C1407 C5-methylase (RsmB/RsmF family)/NOL1/NOP2/fmu family ribosome biogenesis protein
MAEVPTSIRLNPAKPAAVFADASPIAWCANGRYLAERPSFTLDPAFHAGAYYVQEASSMLLHWVFEQVAPKQALNILDLCAAPGGKTTLLASLMPEGSLLVANEVVPNRVKILKENMLRWGHSHQIIANHDPADFAALEGFFDIILVDAPCSGEGMFRKDDFALKQWNEALVTQCALRQNDILDATIPLLKPGGKLIYSTCTFSAAEDIEVLDRALHHFPDLKPIALNPDSSWGTRPFGHGHICYPHLVKGEGFFIAAFENHASRETNFKPAQIKLPLLDKKLLGIFKDWLEEPEAYQFHQKPTGEIIAIPLDILQASARVDQVLKRKSLGISMGELKGTQLIPSHDLAMGHLLRQDIPSVALSKDEALQYLKSATSIPAAAQDAKGWTLMQYEGLNLGWAKFMPGRMNNYLPNELRIRMEVH